MARSNRESFDPREVAAEAARERRLTAALKDRAAARQEREREEERFARERNRAERARAEAREKELGKARDEAAKRRPQRGRDLELLHDLLLRRFIEYVEETPAGELNASMAAVIRAFLKDNGVSSQMAREAEQEKAGAEIIDLLQRVPSFEDYQDRQQESRLREVGRHVGEHLPAELPVFPTNHLGAKDGA